MNETYAVMESPVGDITITMREGAVTTLGTGSRPPEMPRDDDAARDAIEQLQAYFAGELRDFTLNLDPAGTPFQHKVWSALRTIPYGTTTSYGVIARRIGRPTASRAVGAANGRNPIAIVVPCHRVIGSTGALVGYGGGLDMKRTLLAVEGIRLG